MANTTITQLPVISAVSSIDRIPVDRGPLTGAYTGQFLIDSVASQISSSITSAVDVRIDLVSAAVTSVNTTLEARISNVSTIAAAASGGGGGDTSAVSAAVVSVNNRVSQVSTVLTSVNVFTSVLENRISAVSTIAAAGGGGGSSELTAFFDPPLTSEVSIEVLSPGVSVITDDNAIGLNLQIISNAGSTTRKRHGRVQSVPVSTPWSVTSRFRFTRGNTTACGAGIFIRDNTTGEESRMEAFGDGRIFNRYYTNDTFNSNSNTFASNDSFSVTHNYFRISNDGVNLNYQISFDGLSWTRIFQELIADHVTSIDECGVYVSWESGSNVNVGATFHYFDVSAI